MAAGYLIFLVRNHSGLRRHVSWHVLGKSGMWGAVEIPLEHSLKIAYVATNVVIFDRPNSSLIRVELAETLGYRQEFAASHKTALNVAPARLGGNNPSRFFYTLGLTDLNVAIRTNLLQDTQESRRNVDILSWLLQSLIDLTQ